MRYENQECICSLKVSVVNFLKIRFMKKLNVDYLEDEYVCGTGMENKNESKSFR